MNHSIFFFLTLLAFACNDPAIESPEPEISNRELTYLALGDSYTIGHGVAVPERFPMQLTTKLNEAGFDFKTPDIVATTGWTTSNLQAGIEAETDLLDSYSIVTLLIGVNNQYQGQNIERYEKEFPELLNQAIDFAGGNKERVFVVSIPDYAYTPFGAGRESISRGIDLYNDINRRITEDAGITYFDITPISRQGLAEPELVASDNLHPSGEQYRRWVDLMFASVRSALK